MSPMRRSLCVLSFLLLLLSAASVAQVGITPRPAPPTRIIGILRQNDPGNRDAGPGTHGQDGNDRPGDSAHGRELKRQKGCPGPALNSKFGGQRSRLRPISATDKILKTSGGFANRPLDPATPVRCRVHF